MPNGAKRRNSVRSRRSVHGGLGQAVAILRSRPFPSLRAAGEAIKARAPALGCFVAPLLAMTEGHRRQTSASQASLTLRPASWRVSVALGYESRQLGERPSAEPWT